MADIRIDSADGIATLLLARPDKKNAITDPMYAAFADALAAFAADAAVKVVVVTGEGPDFCAGNDISMFAAAAGGDPAASMINVRRFLDAISTFPKPLVAAVTGRAIGIGATMLLHCDLVYLAEDAALLLPFVDLGLVPEAGSSRLLPDRIGHARAFALFGLGEPLTGTDAVALGIGNAALPAADILPAAQAAARRLAAKPSAALIATKALMRDADAVRAAIDRDTAAFVERLSSPEATAAFAAFAARKG
ncbi:MULTISPECIES: enoyl-CoA hydratase-related protein [unclassified Sphingomonas]|uniref:enoyl-CoA hydratase-related protein n=1 Tax=unclassified Sphingomonas TaxID=196159 RepID=UPI0006F61951|nr:MULTISPECIES: enoyl-CoA hydratase-related protein [unclassified Sphingomonas]KQX18738.1 enoyl-CoA hydratase [Sphingomonas sp. Root1294]KQY71938.1 enoyl-CoA hydratase [Sphingomonas sp. Root50]KRB94797.1 enoyl-CoA hydratase [Sphingomonas sp. Root720]